MGLQISVDFAALENDAAFILEKGKCGTAGVRNGEKSAVDLLACANQLIFGKRS
ncbi:MAG: hypothetical protein V8Q43_02060 [Christensenellaceae bacterium]